MDDRASVEDEGVAAEGAVAALPPPQAANTSVDLGEDDAPEPPRGRQVCVKQFLDSRCLCQQLGLRLFLGPFK